MQDYLKINGKKIKQPDEDGYVSVLATTSTEDSDRDMTLTMRNTPIGTVESYQLKWSDISCKEASEILEMVVNKSDFNVHYFDVLTAKWRDGKFYASNFNAPVVRLNSGNETLDQLSFNIVGVNAR